ncbi:hypothetical protein AAE478_004488 [Parahypoxylon ruwenzoriense]
MSSSKQLRGDSDRAVDRNPLIAEFARVFPKNCRFTAHHLSTPPTLTDPLYHPPAYNPAFDSRAPGDTGAQSKERRPGRPLKTYCEKHFLTISIDAKNEGVRANRQVLVLGLEIYIYTTAFSTIIFVSKADSTGYMNLLDLPKGSPSPIREVTACFLAFLIANRKRPSKQLVVNLFARSQSQYLFPGSMKNNGKHVLDDRGLVKWWCRVLNALLEGGDYLGTRNLWDSRHGYLIIPGLDNYETRAFLPRTDVSAVNWTLGHPLERISPYSKDPSMFDHDIHPRSLIPIYPDDPKARFVQELEESTPEKAKLVSGWKSPKTLDQFWEMMAFRQECSSGRLTGFIWVVFEPRITTKSAQRPDSSSSGSSAAIPTPNPSFSASTDNQAPPTMPRHSQQSDSPLAAPANSPSKPIASTTKKPRQKQRAKKVFKGPIIPRKPHVKTHQRTKITKHVETPHYYWPENGRGQVVLNDNGYKRAVELLLNLEFGTLEQAIASTTRWTNEVNMGENWALEIVGERTIPAPMTSVTNGTVTNLSSMIRRKRGPDDHALGDSTPASTVNTLTGGLVRKKAKLDTGNVAERSMDNLDQSQPTVGPEPKSKFNVLGAGLIRKKPKSP